MVVIVIGSFLLVNVFLANIMSSYSAGRIRMHLKAARTRARQQAIRRLRAYVKYQRRLSVVEEAILQRKALDAAATGTALQLSQMQTRRTGRSAVDAERTGMTITANLTVDRSAFLSSQTVGGEGFVLAARPAPPRKSLPWAPPPPLLQSEPHALLSAEGDAAPVAVGAATAPPREPRLSGASTLGLGVPALEADHSLSWAGRALPAPPFDPIRRPTSIAAAPTSPMQTIRQTSVTSVGEDFSIPSTTDLLQTHIAAGGRNAARGYLRRMSQDVHMARAAHIADSIIAAGYGNAVAAVAEPASAVDALDLMGRQGSTALFDRRLAHISLTGQDAATRADGAGPWQVAPLEGTSAARSLPTAFPPAIAAGIQRVGRRAFAELHRTHSMMLKAGQLGLDSEGGAANRTSQQLRGVGDEALGELRAASEALREVQRLHELRRMHSQRLNSSQPDAVVDVDAAPPLAPGESAAAPTEPPSATAAATTAVSVERRSPPDRVSSNSFDVWGLREKYLRRLEDLACPPRHPVVLFWKS